MSPLPRTRVPEAAGPPRDRPAGNPATAAASAAAGDGRPSDTVRGVATVALAVYLLGLLLTVMANSASGSSSLVRTLVNRLFAPWMAPAWLDLGFDYRLTHGGPADGVVPAEGTGPAEGTAELEIGPWGGPPAAVRRFPGQLRGERAERWRRLARAVAAADDADREGLLATAAARGMFAAVGAQDLAVRVRRLPPRDRDQPQPPAEQVYVARVRMVGDEVQLIRNEPREQLAPLVAAPEAPTAAPPKALPNALPKTPLNAEPGARP